VEYEFPILVTAGKPQAEPSETVCKLTKGIVHHYGIQFLQGCNGLVFVAIDHGGHQAFPINRDHAFSGNDVVIGKETFYPLEVEPYELKVRAWSPDCSYEHTVTVRFDLLPREHLEPQTILTKAIQSMARLLGVKG